MRNGYGQWPGLRAAKLFPSIFTPLCVPELRAAAEGLSDPRSLAVPLLGRPDWWEIWYRALGIAESPPPSSFGTSLATEHLDITAALAGHGIAIGSPILFQSEIDAGCLITPHEMVASDGREFWLTYPITRQCIAKIGHLRDWLLAEAEASLHGARFYIDKTVAIFE